MLKKSFTPKTVLSIAGFDGSGGAGIQADLKTFSALGCYGTTVLTALPVQNTTGVKSCYEIPLSAIQEQLEAIFSDIIPDTIKIGMLFKTEIIDLVSDFLSTQAVNAPIVLDPVMVAKSGDPLLLPSAIHALKTKLIPLSTLITPNLPEAKTLTNLCATSSDEIEALAAFLLTLGPQAVLLKGGHAINNALASDFYIHQDGTQTWLETKRIDTKNTHGTGCTLSAAIAAYLALGFNLIESCRMAKHYLTEALKAAQHQSLGQGAGPVDHFWALIDIHQKAE